MNHYSVLAFQSDINEQTINQLTNLLKQGVKVFYFTFDPVEQLYENDLLAKAKQDQFLFAYETMFTNDWQDEEFSYFDGKVPQYVLQELSEQTPFFNKEQYIIEHAALQSNLMISAGAGTGKTTVMINRIFFLKHIDSDLLFSDIGLVTFTNKAAANMREKLIQRTKGYFQLTKDVTYLQWLQEIRNMKIGTIHSFAYSMFEHFQEELFSQSQLRISQFRYRRKKIIEEVIDDFQELEPELFRKFKYIEQYKIISAVETLIDQMGNLALSSEKIDQINFGSSSDDSHRLYSYLVKETSKRLTEYKKQEDFFDVNDLIIELDKLMAIESDKELPFRYIFVDEFQDTDQMQTKFFAYLANRYPVHLFVVGDVKQSIYRFRGADYTAFDQLKNQTTIDQTYYLQHNYRTDRPLLDSFNQLFATWPGVVSTFRFEEEDKLLAGFEPEQELENPVIHKNFSTNAAFTQFLKRIENTNTAILVRSNREVNQLAAICDENKIYYTADKDGDFFRSLPVREFYMLIRRFTHPTVWKNRYALHLSSYGERSIEVNQILEHFSDDKQYIQPMLEKVDMIYHHYQGELTKRPVFEVLADVIEEVQPAQNYAQRFERDRKHLYKEAIRGPQLEVMKKEYQLNLDHLFYMLKNELKDTVPTLPKLEKVLRLKMNTDRSESKLFVEDNEMDRLTIMTVHKAKGLEFDYVFLPYTKNTFDKFAKTDVIMDEDKVGYKTFIEKGKIFSNDAYQQFRSEEKVENIGEEARLFYVALTRARKGVYIDAPEQVNSHTIRSWGDLYARGYQRSETIVQP
ncbi:UvrD-helicase domain-containing protein [Oceanobacillus halotolerans]|uniref:UvrD-helicase domain-containing protein n=1 Tax=Oceanobacillus halotolerans TaxID=2663380 RepID=UPI0013D94BF7|nr:UvrD-helicase domain-containing protein [Oceanobacillus halotolerans]